MADREAKLPGLTSGDRLILVILLAALIGLLSVHYALRAGIGQAKAQFIPAAPLAEHKINVNTAPWWELQVLQGIGEKRAKDIVAFRLNRGPIKSLYVESEELIRGPALAERSGFGPKTLDRLRDHLTVGQEGSDD